MPQEVERPAALEECSGVSSVPVHARSVLRLRASQWRTGAGHRRALRPGPHSRGCARSAGSPQKRSEAAAGLCRPGRAVEQIGEEPLNEVAGIVGPEPPPAHERVQGIPVIAAQPLEGVPASGSDRSPACATRLQQVVGKRTEVGLSNITMTRHEPTDLIRARDRDNIPHHDTTHRPLDPSPRCSRPGRFISVLRSETLGLVVPEVGRT